MSDRVVAIGLKIPDNAAYSALTALQRLGVAVARIERSELHRVRDVESDAAVAARVEANESIFNSNKHRLTVLPSPTPREGEVWISEVGTSTITAWRLFDDAGSPAMRTVLEQAADRLLCNPAVERAFFPGEETAP